MLLGPQIDKSMRKAISNVLRYAKEIAEGIQVESVELATAFVFPTKSTGTVPKSRQNRTVTRLTASGTSKYAIFSKHETTNISIFAQ